MEHGYQRGVGKKLIHVSADRTKSLPILYQEIEVATVQTFEKAMEAISGAKQTVLLLGNGFSIALKTDIFTYGSLYENANLDALPNVKKLFDILETKDFEIVIKHLQDAATVVQAYKPDETALITSLRDDASKLKDVLVATIAERHPDRPYNVAKEQYAACRAFLSRFGRLFTLNYDVLLYWALMQDEVDELHFNHDDGFRHPEGNPDQPWVSWQQANSATVSYLHGALHLFDAGAEITKYTWSKTEMPIVDQVRAALGEEKYPIFVSEGSSESKRTRIMHSAYLHKALRSFESYCNPAGNAVVIYGHSLAKNDEHVLRYIAHGRAKWLLVSLYGDPNSGANLEIIGRAQQLANSRRSERYPLEVIFYDAASAKVWG